MKSVKKYYARSVPNCSLKEWQPLKDHSQQVALQAAYFAELFDSFSWAYNAGILHDIGKILDEFQVYLRRENEIDDPAYG